MRTLWNILTWTPAHQQPWHWHAFHYLWTAGLVIGLGLSMSTWLDHPVPLGESSLEETEKQPDWNSDLYIGNGKCLVIETRNVYNCQEVTLQ